MIRDRRARTAHVSHERWLVSYADFVTLLFAFFVVLYASAQVDRQRALQLSDAIRSGFQQLGVFQGGKAAAAVMRSQGASASANYSGNKAEEFAAISTELQQALASEIERKEVALHLERDGAGRDSARSWLLR